MGKPAPAAWGASQHGPRCLIREPVDVDAVVKKILLDETQANATKQAATTWESIEKRPEAVEGFHPMPDFMSQGKWIASLDLKRANNTCTVADIAAAEKAHRAAEAAEAAAEAEEEAAAAKARPRVSVNTVRSEEPSASPSPRRSSRASSDGFDDARGPTRGRSRLDQGGMDPSDPFGDAAFRVVGKGAMAGEEPLSKEQVHAAFRRGGGGGSQSSWGHDRAVFRDAASRALLHDAVFLDAMVRTLHTQPVTMRASPAQLLDLWYFFAIAQRPRVMDVSADDRAELCAALTRHTAPDMSRDALLADQRGAAAAASRWAEGAPAAKRGGVAGRHASTSAPFDDASKPAAVAAAGLQLPPQLVV
eukprot:gene15135-6086_t